MATISSNGTGGGLASLGASWAGGIAPVDGDKVNIVAGDTITLDTTAHQWGDDTTTAINIKSTAILKASRAASSTLRCKGSLIVESGGELDLGKSGDAIPAAYNAIIQTNYSAAIAADKYSLTVANGGKFYMYGAERTRNTLLNGAVSVGATSAVVDTAANWAIGDEIVFSNTVAWSVGNNHEKRTLTSVAGTTIGWTAGLTYAHADNAEVGNLTSNSRITSHTTGATSQGYVAITVGNNTNFVQLQHAEFGYVGDGQSAINVYGGSSTVNAFKYDYCSQHDAGAVTSPGIMFFNTTIGTTISNNNSYNPSSANNSGNDMFFYGGNYLLTVDDHVFYGRNSTQGSCTGTGGSQGGNSITMNRCKFLGGYTAFSGGVNTVINNCIVNSFIACQNSYGTPMRVNNCTIGGGGVGTRNCNSAVLAGSQHSGETIFTDCTFNLGSSFVSGNQYQATRQWKTIVANKNVNPSSQEIYLAGGNFIRDNSTYKDGASSLRFDRIASSIVPASLSFYIFAPTGQPIAVSGFLRKNSSYGSSNRPYVTLTGLGITTSTYTMTDVNDTWEQFTVSGTQVTGTDGLLILTVYFQSSAASAQAWIDGVSAPTPVAVNSGDFGYWGNGQPVDVIASNFTAPIDVWNVLKADAVLANSMGELANRVDVVTGDNQALILVK